MIDVDRVLDLFSLFSDLDPSRAARWRSACQAACARLAARIRPDADVNAGMEDLCCAAAAWVYCDYLILESSGTAGGEVRVGDVSVKDSGTADLQTATEIRNHFLRQAAYLLKPEYPALLTTVGSL